MAAITTHVLDTSRGCPAAGVDVVLERMDEAGRWRRVGRGATDADGRLRSLLGPGTSASPGVYRLTFAAGAYFAQRKAECFYPTVTVTFQLVAEEAHYHVPLLLSPFGYSTYRGS